MEISGFGPITVTQSLFDNPALGLSANDLQTLHGLDTVTTQSASDLLSFQLTYSNNFMAQDIGMMLQQTGVSPNVTHHFIDDLNLQLNQYDLSSTSSPREIVHALNSIFVEEMNDPLATPEEKQKIQGFAPLPLPPPPTPIPISTPPTAFVSPGDLHFNGDLITDSAANAQMNMAKGYNPYIPTSSINVDGTMGDTSASPPGMKNCTYVSSQAFQGANTGGTLVFGQSTSDGHLLATYEGVDAQYQPLQLSFNATGPNGQWSDSDLQHIHDGILQSWGNDPRHSVSMQTLRAAIGDPNGQNSLGPSKQPQSDLSGDPAASDCFALASINALASTTQGTSQLLSMIKPLANGNYSVTFPGDPNQKAYTVSPAEISSGVYNTSNANNPFVTGDVPTAILAVAMNKFSLDHGGSGLMNGGSPNEALTLLTGKASRTMYIDPNNPTTKDAVKAAIQSQLAEGSPATVTVPMKSGERHILTITGYDPTTNMVTSSNPWDSSKQYTQNIDSFLNAPNDGSNDFGAVTALEFIANGAGEGTTTTIN